MARGSFIVARFGGVNTEEPVNRLASGTARVSRNVRLEGTSLQGRPGFGEYDANAGALNGIISATTFPCDSGDWYLVVKRYDGAKAGLDYARIYTSGAAVVPSWTDMVDMYGGHSVSDKGWWFVWADRVYHFDRTCHATLPGGGTKWNATSTRKPAAVGAETAPQRAWKAGIESTVGPVIEAAAGGAMSGWYFAGAVKKNSTTRELSCIQHLQSNSVETRSNVTGGLTVKNSGASDGIQTDADDNLYEWDTVQFVRTTGAQKVFGNDSWTQQMFFDTAFARGTVADSSMSISDTTLATRLRHTNSGGVPPASQHGAFNGLRAAFGGIYWAGSPVYGQVAFSLQRFPCMVPGDQTYTAGGTSLTWAAEPYDGFLSGAVPGICRAIRPVGGRFVVITDSGSMWLVAPNEAGGAMVAIDSGVPGGCASDEGAVATSRGAYWLGPEIFMAADGRGIRNVALNHFTPTLAEIPAAQRSYTVGAAYTGRHEVWMAVSRAAPFDCDHIVTYDHDASSPDWREVPYTDVGTGYTYPSQLLPDSPAEKDAFHLVWTAKPDSIAAALLVNRPAKYASAGCLTPQYYTATGDSVWAELTAYAVGDTVVDSGAGGDGIAYVCIATRDDTSTDRPATDTTHWEVYWADLPVTTDGTNPDDSTGGRPCVDDGTIAADAPADWASITLPLTAGGTVSGYAVRWRVATGKEASITRTPILTSTGPSRILIYDEDRDELVGWFDPRNLLGSYITWMCELARPCDAPTKMLLFLADGRILYYPSATYADSVAGDSWNYSTDWTGYFGQEGRHREGRDVTARVHMGANARRLSMTVTGLKTGAEDIESEPVELDSSSDALADGLTFDPYRNGILYKVRFTTTASEALVGELKCNSPDWSVTDLILETVIP